MPNAMRILSNHCKSKPTDRDTLSSSVGFLYTGYLTLTSFRRYVTDGEGLYSCECAGAVGGYQ